MATTYHIVSEPALIVITGVIVVALLAKERKIIMVSARGRTQREGCSKKNSNVH